jgi:hypothetical protein
MSEQEHQVRCYVRMTHGDLFEGTLGEGIVNHSELSLVSLEEGEGLGKAGDALLRDLIVEHRDMLIHNHCTIEILADKLKKDTQ